MYPNKTLIIGIIKYPKLASIILSVATAYIQMDQFIKINKPEKNKLISVALLDIILKKKFHFERNVVVKINIAAVHKHL
jgi:hypothetical protein